MNNGASREQDTSKGARYKQGSKMLLLILSLTKIMTIDHHYNAPPPLFLGYRQYQVTLINRNVETLHATSLPGWVKIVYYSYLMRHDIRAKENNIQYQVQIISDRTVSFVLLRHLLAEHFVCVAFQRKGKSAIHNPTIKDA